MNFCFFAEQLSAIESISSRLEITQKLASLFASATPAESRFMAYLLCAGLGPQYKNITFGIAEKQTLATLGNFFPENFRSNFLSAAARLGDQGEAFCLVRKNQLNQESFCAENCTNFGLSMLETFTILENLATTSGTGSVQEKQVKIHALLQQLCPNGSKYVIKIILGKLRLGFSEMTILESLSWMQANNKSLKDRLEAAFNLCADIGLLAQTLKGQGIAAVQNFSATPGIPVRPAAAERMESVDAIAEKLGPCIAQPKLDGLRVQVHKFMENDEPQVKFFSRNLLDISEMFPELCQVVQNLPAQNFIAEGEAIAVDTATQTFLPFQETAKRRRKHGVAEAASKNPLTLFLFDLLFLNHQSLLTAAHSERRAKLSKLLLSSSATNLQLIEEQAFFESSASERAEKLEAYFEAQIDLGLEGLVVKRPDAEYKAGKRNFNWIKLKRLEKTALNDTIDCVIMGYYFGRGKRASFGLGALLAGVYNPKNDTFETVCKIGTGLSDADLKSYKELCDANRNNLKPQNFAVAKTLEPDVWVNPSIVVCVRADQISKSPAHTAAQTLLGSGLALRFPRLVCHRIDKSASDATSSAELAKLSEQQRLG